MPFYSPVELRLENVWITPPVRGCASWVLCRSVHTLSTQPGPLRSRLCSGVNVWPGLSPLELPAPHAGADPFLLRWPAEQGPTPCPARVLTQTCGILLWNKQMVYLQH